VIEIVSATRLSGSDFWSKSALGWSLRRLAQDARLTGSIAADNRSGLPTIYNARIDAGGGGEILAFVHDDVWIDDFFFAQRVVEGLGQYDVIGVAGNRRRVARQPGWAFVDDSLAWDDRANLSGAVAHGVNPLGAVSVFGPAPAECELLDGVFLATRKAVLQTAGVRFDPAFDFNFYDMDFCRLARARGLRLGTWPICLTHQSGGAFGSAAWREKYGLYLDKWKS
jgi:hypothetical protein